MQRKVGEEPPYTKISNSGLNLYQDQDSVSWNSFPNATNPEDFAFSLPEVEQFDQTESNCLSRISPSNTDAGISSGPVVGLGKKYSSLIDHLASVPEEHADKYSPLMRLREIILSSRSLQKNRR